MRVPYRRVSVLSLMPLVGCLAACSPAATPADSTGQGSIGAGGVSNVGGSSGGAGATGAGATGAGATGAGGTGATGTSAGGTGAGLGGASSGGSGAQGGAAVGGTAGAGAQGGTTAGGSGGTMEIPPPSRPEGDIPNDPQPEDKVDVPREDWEDGLISPTLESEHHNQPSIINGYLQLTGNARFSIYDIHDPTQPEQLSVRVSPDNCDTCGPAGEGEAEGHQVGFAKYGDRLYTATISGLGIDTWEITDARDPQHLQSIPIEGVNFGDFTEAIWGVAWQGSTLYIGGTNTGLHILDATDPANITLVDRLPTSSLGGVSAGPVFAVGNILVITTPKESGGIATLDISDPHAPILLDAIQTSASYIGAFYRRHLYLQSPLRAWDVLSDPTTIGSADAPMGSLNTPASEYMSFSDGYMFLGLLRPDPGAAKIDVSDVRNMQITGRIWGRMNLTDNDDQFTVAVGNLLVMSDDQLVGGGSYAGSIIGVHARDPDSAPPEVDTLVPKPGATGQSLKSRIGISFSDNVELATVDPWSVIVRPVGGAPIPGVWGSYATVLNFDPDEDLLPGTTYEVVVSAGRITDYVGNPIAEDFTSTFTTR